MLIKILKKTFFADLFQTDKTLFFLVILFVAGQFFFTWKGVETFPFLHWGMYSGKAQQADETEIIQLNIDHQPICVSCLPDVQGAIVQGTFNWFVSLQQNNFIDTTAKVFSKRFKGKLPDNAYEFFYSRIINDSLKAQQYPKWLLQYLADMRLVENPTIQGKKLTVRYNPNAYLDTVKSKELFYYVAPY